MAGWHGAFLGAFLGFRNLAAATTLRTSTVFVAREVRCEM